MNFSEWLLSTIGTGAVLSALGWILRDWIASHLKKAIEHDYNKKLEKYKSDLKTETDKQLLKIQSKANVEFEKFKVITAPINNIHPSLHTSPPHAEKS